MSQLINIIYLLGAGRSGTTLLATLLNNHDSIKTLGEMHQFFEFLFINGIVGALTHFGFLYI